MGVDSAIRVVVRKLLEDEMGLAPRAPSPPRPPSRSFTFEWLNASQAAAFLGLPTRKALYQAVRRGEVPVHRFGAKRMRFKKSELESLLAKGKRERPTDALVSLARRPSAAKGE
jgi:excisionase family DNA binding protein